jgi:NTP pyrophosphatase (non-canonical NTP hydrolase)
VTGGSNPPAPTSLRVLLCSLTTAGTAIFLKEFVFLKRGALLVVMCVSITKPVVLDTHSAQISQNLFDDRFFDINEGFFKIRHILLHLMKTVGKFATYCEAIEHSKEVDQAQLIHEVLPDLLIHALQIANAYDIDLGEEYAKRIQFLIERNQQQHKSIESQV